MKLHNLSSAHKKNLFNKFDFVFFSRTFLELTLVFSVWKFYLTSAEVNHLFLPIRFCTFLCAFIFFP